MSMHIATQEDLKNFKYDGIELEYLKGVDIQKQLEAYFALGPVIVGKFDGELICIGGWYQISPGVLQSWMLFNKAARPHAQEIAEKINEQLTQALDENYHRVQTFVFEGKKDLEKYAEIMGFQWESVMKSFGPNKEDVIIYRMVKE